MNNVVYLTMYSGELLPRWYIGSSYENKILNGYNGSVSSKKWGDIYSSEQKENKHLFKTRILSYHDTKIEALEEELRLQKMLNVVRNVSYINESYAQPNGFFGRDVSGELNPNYNNKWTEYQKIKASIRSIGRIVTTETREKISKNMSGENHWNYGKISHINGLTYENYYGKERAEDIKNKISEKLIGRIITKDSIEKMKSSNYHSASSYEERFGKERAKDIKEKIRLNSVGNKNPNASQWKLISPFGEIFESHGNIDVLLKKHNLSISTMKLHINKGKIRMKNLNNKHNNWELIKI